MSVPTERLRLIRGMIEKAEHDRLAAEHTLKMGDDCPYDVVCFHAQQLAEKYLKALMIAEGIEFPHTHSIERLVGMLPESKRPHLSAEEQATLTDHAVESRYFIDSLDGEPLTRQDAEIALSIAIKTRNLIRSSLPQGVL